MKGQECADDDGRHLTRMLTYCRVIFGWFHIFTKRKYCTLNLEFSEPSAASARRWNKILAAQILYPAHYSSNTISLLANGSHNAFEEKLSFSFILGTLSSSGVTRRGTGEGASPPKKVRCLTYKISSTNSLYGAV